MRERLIELIKNADNDKNLWWYDLYDLTHEGSGCAGYFADYLLANGVIVLPCKVGDDIYRVGKGEIWEWQIAMAYIHPDETVYVDDSENEFTEKDIGKTVFLTKEEAEKALKERDGNG